MANIYDGEFRTILNDCQKLIIPIINEIFGETYTGEEEIQFFPNEHFIDQQDEADKERITDTNFKVFGKVQKKYHMECESGLQDWNGREQSAHLINGLLLTYRVMSLMKSHRNMRMCRKV